MAEETSWVPKIMKLLKEVKLLFISKGHGKHPNKGLTSFSKNCIIKLIVKKVKINKKERHPLSSREAFINMEFLKKKNHRKE